MTVDQTREAEGQQLEKDIAWLVDLAAMRRKMAADRDDWCSVLTEDERAALLVEAGRIDRLISLAGAQRTANESAWLIEGWDSRTGVFNARWWAGYHAPDQDDGDGWTNNSLFAMRFSRQCDAQAFIDNIPWSEAKPTEHGWPSLALGAQGGVCGTCNGQGVVGGWSGQTAESGGYDSEPCPDCTPRLRGCGSIDCVNACDGDFTHETCPNASPARIASGGGGEAASLDVARSSGRKLNAHFGQALREGAPVSPVPAGVGELIEAAKAVLQRIDEHGFHDMLGTSDLRAAIASASLPEGKQ